MKSTAEQEEICKKFILSKMGQDYMDNMKLINPEMSMCDMVVDLFVGYSEEKITDYAAGDFRDLKRVYPELAIRIGTKLSETKVLTEKDKAMKELGL